MKNFGEIQLIIVSFTEFQGKWVLFYSFLDFFGLAKCDSPFSHIMCYISYFASISLGVFFKSDVIGSVPKNRQMKYSIKSTAAAIHTG